MADLGTLGKEVNLYQRQREIQRYTGNRSLVSQYGPSAERIFKAKEEARIAFPIYCEHLGLPAGTRFIDLRPTKAGTVREIELPAWDTPRIRLNDLRRAHARWINGGISAERVIVKKKPENERRILIYTIFNSAFDLKNAPSMPAATKNKLPLAYDVEGDIRWFGVGPEDAKHCIVAGMTGSGKSNTMEHLLGCYYEQGHEIWIGDPTGGSEFVEYESLATHVAWSPEACSLLLRMVVDEINRRYAELGRRRIKFWDGQPLDVFIDELPSVLDKGLILGVDEKGKDIKQGATGISALKAIAMRGRRAGTSLTVGIQSPRAEDMSGAARSQFPLVICHRVRDTTETGIILGAGSVEAGYDAAKLPLKGRAYYFGPGSPDISKIQVFRARSAKEILNGRPGHVPHVVSDGFGSVSVSSRGAGGVFAEETSNGTTEPNPMAKARDAQLKAARSLRSKWAIPILEVLRKYDRALGPEALSKAIVLVDDDGNKQSPNRGRVSEVLETLEKANLVSGEKGSWTITEAGLEVIPDPELADFYAEEEDE